MSLFNGKDTMNRNLKPRDTSQVADSSNSVPLTTEAGGPYRGKLLSTLTIRTNCKAKTSSTVCLVVEVEFNTGELSRQACFDQKLKPPMRPSITIAGIQAFNVV